MKKLLFILLLFTSLILPAQNMEWGVKGGINYNSASFSEVAGDVFSGAKSRAGFHAGLWFRGRIAGFNLRPEIYYAQLNSDVVFNGNGTTPQKTDFHFSKIDIPVLLEKNIAGKIRTFIGPSFQFITSSGFGVSNIKDVKLSDFTLGIQVGGGIEFGNLGLDIRWDRSLTTIESSIASTVLGLAGQSEAISFDTRVNQIVVGVYYKL